MGRARLFVSAGVLVSLLGLTHTTSSSEASVVIEQIGSDIDGEAEGDFSGEIVALSSDGNTIAIGAPGNDANTADPTDDRGHVRIYTWNGTAWTQQGTDIDGEAAGDRSGSSVALSSDGNTVAIGAPRNDANDRGHVRIYTWNGTAWTQLGTDIDGEAAGDRSGSSVALSSDGNTVAIGAPLNDANTADPTDDRGHVRIFTWDGTAWTQQGDDIDGNNADDNFGSAVALSGDGNTVAVGAPWNDTNANNSGQVRVHSWNGTTWTQLGSDINGRSSGDTLGEAVALSNDGSTVAVGAPRNDTNANNSGQVRVHSWNGTTWTQLGSDINGRSSGDTLGWSVATSSDGKTIAIGAMFADIGSTPDAGYVQIHTLIGTSWSQRGNNILGQEIGEWSGESVALSSDGSVVAVGAAWNDDGGFEAGRVSIFKIRTVTDYPSLPVTPVWRVTLDPNAGTCVDSTERTEPWTSVFVGYRYLPNATDCTRPGYTFTGWATTTDPGTSVTLPNLVDPSDNQRRAFLAANANLIAMWTPDPTPITDVNVFANFMCGPCTNLWLIHPPVEPDTTIDIAVNDQPTTCSTSIEALGLTFCEIEPLAPGDHTITLTPRHDDVTGTPARLLVTLNP